MGDMWAMRAELEDERFTWHALEAACCMGEMWAMRAELEDEGPGLHGMH